MSIAQWRIDNKLDRARRKLAMIEAKAALWRQINDIDKKLTMLAEIKGLYPEPKEESRDQPTEA